MSEFVFIPASPSQNGVVCKISSTQTDYAYTVLEFTLPPQVAVPLHTHEREDELIFVMEGECWVEVQGERHVATAGALIRLPKGMPHAFGNPATTPNRLQITAIPGGLDDYFAELSALGNQATQEQVDALNLKYELDFSPNAP